MKHLLLWKGRNAIYVNRMMELYSGLMYDQDEDRKKLYWINYFLPMNGHTRK